MLITDLCVIVYKSPNVNVEMQQVFWNEMLPLIVESLGMILKITWTQII